MIHLRTPFRIDKNLGAAYNDAFDNIPDDDWVCLMDHDILFLTPDAVNIMYGYIERYPDAGVITCLTNRVSPRSKGQLYGGQVSENDSIRFHMDIAEKVKSNLYEVNHINEDISGFLMLVKKSTWNRVKFDDDRLCLGVDTNFGRRILAAGLSILCMRGLYVWHNYRLVTGIKDKSHLYEANPLINILIRASRPEVLDRCLRSVKGQTYKNIKVTCSVDRDILLHNSEAHPMFDIIQVAPRGGSHPWNDYCNALKESVTDGWFMFLDDDDELVNPTAIEGAVKYLTEPNRAVLFQMSRGGVKIPSDDQLKYKTIRRGSVGMPCIFLHHSQKDIAVFDSEKAADYRFIRDVSTKIKVKFINHTVVKVNGENHGNRIHQAQRLHC